MKAILNTGGTMEQGRVTKGGQKMTPEYRMASGVCRINPADWGAMGKPDRVEVSTEVGGVVLFAKPDENVKKGEIFIPRGPWANAIISADTFCTGSPIYKNMEAVVKPSEGKVLEAGELIRQYYQS
ncbi:MAG: hypothetical protein MSIBF_00965 [Candidatus Altiarchaeales archaeon IMC4]|nr:MAG: hypothetical protein MSIBF_00965 [Candidatus Altiarchaeales archaeon IMC4]